ncbi:MAG: glycosyltransferase [Bacteroidota bacterium]
MKLFVLLSRVPYPLEKGDKLRAYHQLKLLHEKHEIFLCCLNFGRTEPDAEEKLKEISTHQAIINLDFLLLPFFMLLALFSRKPLQVGYFFQWSAMIRIRKLIAAWQPDHIYAQLLRTAEYVKDLHHIPKTIDYQDCFSAGTARREKRSSWLTRPIWASEKRRLKYYEYICFEYFENKTIISRQDRDAIPHHLNKDIVIVSNGVDLKGFTPLHIPRTTDLLFTGNMSYPPNVASVLYLVEKILPEIRKSIPAVTLTICGAEPAKAVRDLASDRVIVTGWVKDISAVYHTTRLFIAPMQMGAGLQNKLLEAMACGVPCITSALAANALLESPDEVLLIGHSPEDYAQKVVNLLSNADEMEALAQKGRKFVMENYTWEQAVKPLEELFEKS